MRISRDFHEETERKNFFIATSNFPSTYRIFELTRFFTVISSPCFTRRMAFIAHSLCGGGMENKHKVMNLRNRLVQQVSGCIRREGGKEGSGWSQPLQDFRNLGDKRKSICERWSYLWTRRWNRIFLEKRFAYKIASHVFGGASDVYTKFPCRKKSKSILKQSTSPKTTQCMCEYANRGYRTTGSACAAEMELFSFRDELGTHVGHLFLQFTFNTVCALHWLRHKSMHVWIFHSTSGKRTKARADRVRGEALWIIFLAEMKMSLTTEGKSIQVWKESRKMKGNPFARFLLLYLPNTKVSVRGMKGARAIIWEKVSNYPIQ